GSAMAAAQGAGRRRGCGRSGGASRRRGARKMAVRSSGERRADAAEGDRLAVTGGPDGPLTVRLAGAWSLEHGLPDAAPVEEALAADPPPPAPRFPPPPPQPSHSPALAF